MFELENSILIMKLNMSPKSDSSFFSNTKMGSKFARIPLKSWSHKLFVVTNKVTIVGSWKCVTLSFLFTFYLLSVSFTASFFQFSFNLPYILTKMKFQGNFIENSFFRLQCGFKSQTTLLQEPTTPLQEPTTPLPSLYIWDYFFHTFFFFSLIFCSNGWTKEVFASFDKLTL